MKKNKSKYKKIANENIEELTEKKKEYPKAAIFTEGEVTDEKVIKRFEIDEMLKNRNITEAPSQENLSVSKTNRIDSRVAALEEEAFSIRKNFTIRESTAQMLNELKFLHPNVNIRLNVLIDNAIRHYHEYIIEQGGF